MTTLRAYTLTEAKKSSEERFQALLKRMQELTKTARRCNKREDDHYNKQLNDIILSYQTKPIATLQTAINLFHQILNMNLFPGNAFIHTFLNILSKQENPGLFTELYQFMQTNGRADSSTYAVAIKIAGDLNNEELVSNIYDDILISDPANAVEMYTAVIYAAGKCGLMSIVEEVYSYLHTKNNKNNAATPQIYRATFEVAYNGNDFKLVKFAYECATEKDMLSKDLLEATLIACKKFAKRSTESDYFTMAEDILQLICKRRSLSSIFIINYLIILAGIYKRFGMAKKAYSLIANNTNRMIHNSMINTIGLCKEHDELLSIYQKTKRLPNVELVSYHLLFFAAGEVRDLKLAQNIFRDACEFIKRSSFSEEESAEETKCVARKYLNILVAEKQWDAAEKIYLNYFDEFTGEEINLHNHSFGSAFVGLMLYIMNNQNHDQPITVITGKGLHTPTNETPTPTTNSIISTKRALNDVSECLKCLGLENSLTEHVDNPGRSTLMLVPRPTMELTAEHQTDLTKSQTTTTKVTQKFSPHSNTTKITTTKKIKEETVIKAVPSPILTRANTQTIARSPCGFFNAAVCLGAVAVASVGVGIGYYFGNTLSS